jgi:hypothetical protein
MSKEYVRELLINSTGRFEPPPDFDESPLA